MIPVFTLKFKGSWRIVEARNATMRILFLTSDFDVSNGWGRYSAGFLSEARMRNGADQVLAPEPSRLRAQSPGWHHHPLYPFVAALSAWKLRGVARGVDLIHAATEPVLLHAFFLSLFTRVPYVVSAHGTYGNIRTYALAVRWLYRLAFLHASRVIAVSSYTAAVVRARLPKARVVIISGGFVPAKDASKRTALSLERRILSVGAIKPRKGFHTLIEAVGLLHAKGFVVHVDCIGPKNANAYTQRLAARRQELGVEDHIRFTGRVSEDALGAAYAAADLFVLPSEHDGVAFEGLGLVYLEALAYGLPVIGCYDSGAEDVIQDGVNGFLVPPGQPNALADAIERLLGDAALWRRMSEAAPRSIDRFRWERVGADMDALYREVLSEHR